MYIIFNVVREVIVNYITKGKKNTKGLQKSQYMHIYISKTLQSLACDFPLICSYIRFVRDGLSNRVQAKFPAILYDFSVVNTTNNCKWVKDRVVGSHKVLDFGYAKTQKQ